MMASGKDASDSDSDSEGRRARGAQWNLKSNSEFKFTLNQPSSDSVSAKFQVSSGIPHARGSTKDHVPHVHWHWNVDATPHALSRAA